MFRKTRKNLKKKLSLNIFFSKSKTNLKKMKTRLIMKKSSSLFFSSNKKSPSTSSLKRTLDVTNGSRGEGRDNVSFCYIQKKVIFFTLLFSLKTSLICVIWYYYYFYTIVSFIAILLLVLGGCGTNFEFFENDFNIIRLKK